MEPTTLTYQGSQMPDATDSSGTTSGSSSYGAIAADVLIILLQIIGMVWIGASNLLVVLAILKGPAAMWTANNFLILQLALADLSIAFWMPLNIAMYLYPVLLSNIYLCIFANSIIIFSVGASMLALLCMTFDRLRSIWSPLTYSRDINKLHCIIWMLVIWAFPFVFGFLLPFFWNNKDIELPITWSHIALVIPIGYITYFIMPMFFTITSLLVILNLPILKALHQQLKAIDAISSTTSSALINPVDKAVIKTGLLLIATYVLTWLPYGIMGSILWYGGELVPQDPTFLAMHTLSGVIYFLSSGINPIIYALNRKDFRSQFGNLLSPAGATSEP